MEINLGFGPNAFLFLLGIAAIVWAYSKHKSD